MAADGGMREDAFGTFAEQFARFMGTARFLMYMTLFVIVWVTLNVIGLYGLDWDPYPFILLNLFLSMLDRMGVMFNRTAEGLLDFRRFGGTKHHRTAFAGASTGQQLLYALD